MVILLHLLKADVPISIKLPASDSIRLVKLVHPSKALLPMVIRLPVNGGFASLLQFLKAPSSIAVNALGRVMLVRFEQLLKIYLGMVVSAVEVSK